MTDTTSITREQAKELDELDFEPRGIDQCPNPHCQSFHTLEVWYWEEPEVHHFHCPQCKSSWTLEGMNDG